MELRFFNENEEGSVVIKSITELPTNLQVEEMRDFLALIPKQYNIVEPTLYIDIRNMKENTFLLYFKDDEVGPVIITLLDKDLTVDVVLEYESADEYSSQEIEGNREQKLGFLKKYLESYDFLYRHYLL